MPTTLSFTPNLARLLECPDAEVAGGTLRETLEEYFHNNPRVRCYMLDDQGALRKHVAIFVNQALIGTEGSCRTTSLRVTRSSSCKRYQADKRNRSQGDVKTSDQLLIGTRKGLFRIERRGAGRLDICDIWFLGDPVSLVLAEPGGGRFHATLALGHFGAKMQRSEDGGVSWREAPVSIYPEKPDDIEDKDPMRGVDLPWSTD